MGSDKVLGVTGMPLSGKTTVARVLEDNGYAVLDMGDVVRKELERREISPGDAGEFVNEQRDEKGMDAIAQLSVPYLRDLLEENERVVVTGMRGWSERKRFEKELDCDFEVVAVWASRDTRRRRREERKRAEDVEGQGFHERDLREIENGVGKLMALSDRILVNEGKDMDQLEREIEEKFLRRDN